MMASWRPWLRASAALRAELVEGLPPLLVGPARDFHLGTDAAEGRDGACDGGGHRSEEEKAHGRIECYDVCGRVACRHGLMPYRSFCADDIGEAAAQMRLRFYLDSRTSQPHIYGHDVTEAEVEEVLTDPGEDRPGEEGARIALGRTEAGRYLRVVYVPDPSRTAFS